MQRISDAAAIEARLLELAHTTDAKLTAPALAYFAPCSIDDASRVLEDLAAHERLTMDIEDDGTIVYGLPGRQRIAGARHIAPPMALVPIARPHHRDASPLLAGLLSLWIPGAGQLYAGRIVSAILWFMAVGLGYVLIIPGLVLHLFCIASAASSAAQLTARNHQHNHQLAAAA